MICPVCKASNSEESLVCSSCGGNLDAQTIALNDHHTPIGTRAFATSSRQVTATAAAPARSGIEGLAPGRMLGARYQIEAEAGHGGMGRVYRATDLELNRTVALKVILTELADDRTTAARLKDEIRLASEISHPHVLRIHDLGEADGIRFISMAWVEGEDLDHLIKRRGRLGEHDIARLAEQMCEGLQAAHDKRIIHRDLKPQNILVNATGDACISDFGLAQSLAAETRDHLTQTGHVIGTPRYMSPEQLEGKAVDHRTDIYSLGLVLYEMATGSIPDVRQRLFQKPSDPKLANSAISEKLSRIILRCLEPEPDKRYSTARDIVEDLRRDQSPRFYWLNENRNWIYAAAAACLVAVLAIYFAFGGRTAAVPRPPAEGKYVAVLPFRPIGSDSTLKYYSQGITDAIADRLYALAGVHPISKAAIERADLKQPVKGVARQVGANVVVEGTIENHDGTLVVHSRIENVETGKALSESAFNASANSLPEVEDNIYKQVASALNTQTSGREAPQVTRPTQDPEAYDLYLKGRELLKERHDAQGIASALELFQRASTKDPSFALAWTGVADASLQMYRAKRDSFWADKALDAARRAAADTNNLPEVHFTLGSVYTATGKNAEAVEELKRALQLEPNSDNGYIRLGRAYLATGDSEPALKALKKAVDLNPYYWYNHDQLGLAFFRMGRNEDALKEFRTAADLDPNNPAEYNKIGATYWRLSRWPDCIEEFKKVIKLQPSADAYTNLGTAYFAFGRYHEAIADFKKAVQMNDKHVLYVANLADAYRQAGQQQDANRTYGEAIRLAYQQLQVNPQDSSTMGYLAMCYAKQGDNSKAAEFIRRARSIDPTDTQLMYDKAAIDTLGGRTQEALLALQQALENGYSLEEAKIDPDLKILRPTPGFKALAERFGHADRRP
jgi:serine/threonine-protein kinase